MENVNLQELLQKRQELDDQIRSVRNEQRAEAVATVRRLIAEYDLQPNDLFAAGRTRGAARNTARVEPKYRNPETGETWTGRGKPPRWIADKNRDDYLISPAVAAEAA